MQIVSIGKERIKVGKSIENVAVGCYPTQFVKGERATVAQLIGMNWQSVSGAAISSLTFIQIVAIKIVYAIKNSS